jgi:hypothetical protein
VLSRLFRSKFVAGLKAAFQAGDLHFHGGFLHLAEARAFAAWLRTLFRHDWVVYAKRPFAGPQHALRYLGAYTHRVAISNHRLVTLDHGHVTFRWRDSAHGNKKKPMTLSVDEFLRRFLLHVLPRGFVRIRNLGFLANRRRASLLPICFELLRHLTEDKPPGSAAFRWSTSILVALPGLRPNHAHRRTDFRSPTLAPFSTRRYQVRSMTGLTSLRSLDVLRGEQKTFALRPAQASADPPQSHYRIPCHDSPPQTSRPDAPNDSSENGIRSTTSSHRPIQIA